MEQLDLFEIANQERNEQEEKPVIDKIDKWCLPPKNGFYQKESTLTERQKALYKLIYHNSVVEHRKTTQEEIVSKLAIYGYQWNESENTSDHCSTIWSDVAALNLSFENDNVIITKNYIYWIGSKRETEAFLRKLWKDLAPRLHRYWFYVRKVGMDGCGKLYDKNLNPIFEEGNISDSEINAKLFHDCYNEYDIEMQRAIEENKKADKELNAQGEQKDD